MPTFNDQYDFLPSITALKEKQANDALSDEDSNALLRMSGIDQSQEPPQASFTPSGFETQLSKTKPESTGPGNDFMFDLANAKAAGSAAAPDSASAANDIDSAVDASKAPTQGAPSTKSTSTTPTTATTPSAKGADYDAVKAMLMKKYGLNDDSKALADAQAKAQQNRASANLAQAFGTIATAASNRPKDNSFYDAQREQANMPVQQLLQQRMLKEENLKNAKSIEDLVKETVGNEPSSSINQSFRNALGKIKALEGVDLSGVTVANAGPFQKMADAFISADAHKMQAQQLSLYKQQMMEQRQYRIDDSDHQRNIQAIKKDPNLRSRLQQYQNLDNGLTLLTKSDHITPQQFNEFQQTIRANLGIKGSSGVDERDLTQFKSLGLNAANMKQILTGLPANMKPDDPLLKHLVQLASLEQGNIQNQWTKSLAAAGGGNTAMYKRRPELKQGLDDLISAMNDQVKPAPATPSSLRPPGPPPGSVVKVKGKQYRVGADGDSLEPM